MFREPLPPLTRVERLTFIVLAAGIAFSRIPALSMTLHDWDEMLFASAVREYDVKPHHPHPPGYPLFVLLAKAARFFTDGDFHALQAVATLGSMLVFPAAFLLARELRFPTAHALGAAALTAFLPSLWYYGGTGFSDVPALTLVLFASVFLLRGGRNLRAYVTGALLTAAACSIRPHLLMIAAVPAAVGAWTVIRAARSDAPSRNRAMVAIGGGWLAAAAIVSGSYVGAAFFSSDFPDGYLKELRHIQNHIASTDSFRNPYRPPLTELAPRVFGFPWGGRMRWAILGLVAVALVDAVLGRRRNAGIALAMFLPMAVFTWMMLDVTALSRYAIAFLPLYSFLAVGGVAAIARFVPARAALPVFVLLTAFVTWSLIKWTWPALRFARTTASPAVAAFEWIRTNVPKDGPRVFVHLPLVYHAAYFLPDYQYQLVANERHWNDEDFAAGNVYVFEGETQHPEPRWFRRKRLQLWEIARPRFFEIGIVSMHKVIRWGPGWHLPESDGHHSWRWMARASLTKLAPALYGHGELRLKLHAPVDVTPRRPVVTVTWNGAVVDRVEAPPNGDLALRYVLPSRAAGANELRLETDQFIQPRGDGRELGLSLQAISWSEPAAR